MINKYRDPYSSTVIFPIQQIDQLKTPFVTVTDHDLKEELHLKPKLSMFCTLRYLKIINTCWQ